MEFFFDELAGCKFTNGRLHHRFLPVDFTKFFYSLLVGDFLVSASQTRAALLMQQSDMCCYSAFFQNRYSCKSPSEHWMLSWFLINRKTAKDSQALRKPLVNQGVCQNSNIDFPDFSLISPWLSTCFPWLLSQHSNSNKLIFNVKL